MNKYSLIILVMLMSIGILLRFLNLNWGAPIYFHPDERNIASAVSQLQFPNQMNPNFFAYGSLPIYVLFFSGLIMNFVTTCQLSLTACTVSFEQATMLSRLLAATSSALLIPLLYTIAKMRYSETAGLLAATLGTFSIGFIQFAHFGTYEMLLTIFSTLLLFQVLTTLEKPSLHKKIVLGIITGILISLKISSLALVPLPVLAFFFINSKKYPKKFLQGYLMTIRDGIVVLVIAGIIFTITNPYVFTDSQRFQYSMQYETSLAAGTLPVFYTQEFFNTVPVLYHFQHIYPFLTNPLLVILFLPAFFFFFYSLIKRKDLADFFIWLFFVTLFLSQALLFVKWTRYLIPTLPFFYLILVGTGWYLVQIKKPWRIPRIVTILCCGVVLLMCSFYALAYTYTVFWQEDTRMAAAAFARKSLPQNAHYVTEVYDLGIVPFNTDFPRITLFNFYDLETGNPEATTAELARLIDNADYIILPSQRIYKTRLMQAERFPDGYTFYNALKKEEGYQKVYETPCDFFCTIIYGGDPIFRYENTASVFDRPTVMIYKKL